MIFLVKSDALYARGEYADRHLLNAETGEPITLIELLWERPD